MTIVRVDVLHGFLTGHCDLTTAKMTRHLRLALGIETGEARSAQFIGNNKQQQEGFEKIKCQCMKYKITLHDISSDSFLSELKKNLRHQVHGLRNSLMPQMKTKKNV